MGPNALAFEASIEALKCSLAIQCALDACGDADMLRHLDEALDRAENAADAIKEARAALREAK